MGAFATAAQALETRLDGMQAQIDALTAPPPPVGDPADIRNFGASTDLEDNSAAINAALAAGDILIPVGTWRLTDELVCPSNRMITCSDGTVIERVGGTLSYEGAVSFLRNADHGSGDANITIIGGTWEGNNTSYSEWLWPGSPQNLETGVGFRFWNVTNVTMRGVTIRHCFDFNIQCAFVVGSLFEGLRFIRNMHPIGSMDAFHFNGGCRDGAMLNSRVEGGNNDAFAFNADDTQGANLGGGGDINDMLIDGFIQEPLGGPGIRFLWSDHNINNVTLRNVRGAFNQDRCIGVTADLGGSGRCDNIVFEDFDVTMPEGGDFLRWQKDGGGHVTLRNCRFSRAGQGYFINMPSGSIDRLTLADVEHADSDGLLLQGTIGEIDP